MPTMTRRDATRAGAAAAMLGTFGILSERARGAEFVYKFGNDLPATHPMNIRAQEAAQRILEESGGQLELRVFPNNQLGGDTDMLAQLRSGALETLSISGNILSSVVKVSSLYGIAFAFTGYDPIWAALDGEMGAFLRGAIAKSNMHALDKVWDNGFRQITSSTHPINGPDDLRNFKIRVPVSPLWTSTFEALGAAPTSINFSEVYSALQTRIVEGQENALPLISLAKFYEVQKYVSMTRHMWDGFIIVVNARAWQALSRKLQDVLARNMDEAAVQERADLRKLSATAADELKQHGMIFNDTDPQAFRAVLAKAGFYKRSRENYGPEAWAVLEKYAGPLA